MVPFFYNRFKKLFTGSFSQMRGGGFVACAAPVVRTTHSPVWFQIAPVVGVVRNLGHSHHFSIPRPTPILARRWGEAGQARSFGRVPGASASRRSENYGACPLHVPLLPRHVGRSTVSCLPDVDCNRKLPWPAPSARPLTSRVLRPDINQRTDSVPPPPVWTGVLGVDPDRENVLLRLAEQEPTPVALPDLFQVRPLLV